MLKLLYPACFYPNEDGFTVIVPDLPGCVSEGTNLANAFEMITDAACGWVLDELEDGNPIPEASDISTVLANEYPDGFTSMIILDMDTYAEQHGDKSIRKNCTLPAWLNNLAEKNNINFSQILQEALIQKLNI